MKITEEKAKAYDEALAKAKALYDSSEPMSGCSVILETIFPKLKESEDEKIRKTLSAYFAKFKSNDMWDADFSFGDIVAWLEKQGEKKSITIDVNKMVSKYSQTKDGDLGLPVNCMIRAYRQGINDALNLSSNIEKQGEHKSVDKVEPKFHEGEWVTNGDYTWKIVEVKPLDYILQSQDGNIVDDTIFHVDEQFHLWTIADAKDGDVLATSAGAFIYNGNNGGGSCPGSYCGIDTLGGFKTGVEHHWTSKKAYPATKEQRTELFLKMHEAGYEWNAEKKELKLLITNGGDFCESENCEKKSAWSEGDDAYKLFAISAVEDYYDEKNPLHKDIVDWLKSLKNRIQPKQELSEEDDIIISKINSVLNAQEYHDGATGIKMNPYKDALDWLKSLKDRVQPRQEWSEDDKKMLESIIYDFGKGRQSTTSQDNWLKSLAPWSIPKIRFV